MLEAEAEAEAEAEDKHVGPRSKARPEP